MKNLEQLQSELISLTNEKESDWAKRHHYHNLYLKDKMPNNKRWRDKYDKEILKAEKKIEELKYQISIGGRKLKSAITISKELSNAGFRKGEYHASGMVRGWGNWTGEFVVKSEPKQIEINWIGSNLNYQKFVEFVNQNYPEAEIKGKYVCIAR